MTATAAVAVIFVPGIRAKPRPEVQREQLARCLRFALGNAGATPAEAETLTRALELVPWSYDFYGVHDDIDAFLPGIDALLAGSGDPEADRRDALAPGRRFTAAMYAIGDRFPALGRIFATRRMQTRLHEMSRYFDNSDGAGERIRAQLTEHLQRAWAAGKRVVLVGHSFGSVIAYDALWELTHVTHDARNVECFVSMGSPLALRYIRERLLGSQRQGAARYPANIRRWLNLAAVGEVTALDLKMAEQYAEMLQLRLVERINDNLAVLNRFRGPAGINPHKCYGYFASEVVGAALLRWYREGAA
ncbi:MAG: hypothetical protein V2J12_11025 [Gammaproteobacteria bacterium]|jgi:hypothetical protein|nr:hypothetical protein [Gammaproteobacteria bacterium]